MTPEQKAKELGLEFPEQQKGYLNLCCRAGNLYFLSGHVSDMKGILGDNASRQASLKNLSVEEGQKAARECAVKLLRSVRQANGTLDGLRIIKLLGCVYSAPNFTDQHQVINGASDLFHEIFGKDGDGYHARSALGFAALPTGAAVEVEAIIEIKHG